MHSQPPFYPHESLFPSPFKRRVGAIRAPSLIICGSAFTLTLVAIPLNHAFRIVLRVLFFRLYSTVCSLCSHSRRFSWHLLPVLFLPIFFYVSTPALFAHGNNPCPFAYAPPLVLLLAITPHTVSRTALPPLAPAPVPPVSCITSLTSTLLPIWGGAAWRRCLTQPLTFPRCHSSLSSLSHLAGVEGGLYHVVLTHIVPVSVNRLCWLIFLPPPSNATFCCAYRSSCPSILLFMPFSLWAAFFPRCGCCSNSHLLSDVPRLFAVFAVRMLLHVVVSFSIGPPASS